MLLTIIWLYILIIKGTIPTTLFFQDGKTLVNKARLKLGRGAILIQGPGYDVYRIPLNRLDWPRTLAPPAPERKARPKPSTFIPWNNPLYTGLDERMDVPNLTTERLLAKGYHKRRRAQPPTIPKPIKTTDKPKETRAEKKKNKVGKASHGRKKTKQMSKRKGPQSKSKRRGKQRVNG